MPLKHIAVIGTGQEAPSTISFLMETETFRRTFRGSWCYCVRVCACVCAGPGNSMNFASNLNVSSPRLRAVKTCQRFSSAESLTFLIIKLNVWLCSRVKNAPPGSAPEQKWTRSWALWNTISHFQRAWMFCKQEQTSKQQNTVYDGVFYY